MAIVKITRDWGDNPSIVRVIATAPDTLTSVAAAGYITAQADNIRLANNGDFQWRQSDEVLINAGGTLNPETTGIDGGTNGFFQINSTFTSLIVPATTSPTFVGLTAHAGGGQTLGTPLKAGFNQFSTVVTAADSATLPATVLGQTVVVTNNGAASMNVFPALGNNINSLSNNTALAVAVGATTSFVGVTATNWQATTN
jgi:hypothetical protein